MRFGTARKKVVGIDIAKHGIVGVVSQHGSDKVRAADVFSLPVPVSEDGTLGFNPHVQSELRKTVAAHGLRGKPVVLSVPNDQVIVRYLQMPEIPESALKQAIEVELGATIHLPFEDPVIDVRRVPRIGAAESETDQMGVCLIAAPKSIISDMAGLVKGAGLVPFAVEIQPLALLRAGNIKPCDPAELMILVQLGEDELSLSIFVGPHLYFFRNIGIGQTLDDPMLLRSAAGDIVYEMNRVINFFNYNLCEVARPLGCVYFHTQHPKKMDIVEEVKNQLSTEVSLVEGGAVADNANVVVPEAFVALGLSMRRG